jgi:membrane-associated phospholipid phosphatase
MQTEFPWHFKTAARGHALAQFSYEIQETIKKRFMPLPIGKSIHDYFVKRPFYSTSLDKHLKWIPYAVVFVLDAFGTKTRSGWKKQAIMAAVTDATRYLIVDNLKKLTHEHRPAPYTGDHSFPSGHTSSSFAGAEFMHEELKNSLPVLSCTGYIAAAATGAIRIMKNRHWLIDVVFGAAIGVFSAKLTYYLANRSMDRKNKRKTNYTDPDATEKMMQLEYD